MFSKLACLLGGNSSPQPNFWKVPLHVASSSLFIFHGVCQQTRAADPSTLHEVITVLDDIAQSGFTAVRSWAFNDGPRWNSLQPEPGCYNNDVFAGLDRVIFEAGRRGLRVLLCLTDYWEHFGGMKQYVEWSRRSCCDNNLIPLHEQDSCSSDKFYESQWCQARFQQFVASILNRKNSITGMKYCEDPAILGWAPANEPRCPSDEDCRRQTVARWIHSISQFIKTIDSNHIIFADLEGWYGPSIPDFYSQNPLGCSKGTGCDWFLECSSPYVDVACIHLYPDSWLPSENEQTKLEFTLKWIADHANIAKVRLKKPMALTEFGKKPCPSQVVPNARAKWYESVLNHCASLMSESSGLAGIMVWMAAARSYPDYDGFTLYFTPRVASSCHQSNQDAENTERIVCAFRRFSSLVSSMEMVEAHESHPNPKDQICFQEKGSSNTKKEKIRKKNCHVQ